TRAGTWTSGRRGRASRRSSAATIRRRGSPRRSTMRRASAVRGDGDELDRAARELALDRRVEFADPGVDDDAARRPRAEQREEVEHRVAAARRIEGDELVRRAALARELVHDVRQRAG